MIKLHRGFTRTVLVVNGLAFKFARIYLKAGFRNIWFYYKESRLKEGWRYSYHQIGGIKYCFFMGIISNWLEFIFYLRHRHLFLVPTYFSLFGLVNIQPAKKIPEITMSQLWKTLHLITDGAVEADDHVFAGRTNFCNDNGRLRILDYASPKTQEVLLKYANSIYSQFKFSES